MSQRRSRTDPSRIAAVGHFFSREVWARELTTLPTFRRLAYKAARVAYLAGSNFVKDRCTWRASALTYITVLSLVPMLAFAFSVAKGLGVYQSLREDAIEEFLDQTFGPAAAVPALVEAAEEDREADLTAKSTATEEGDGLRTEPAPAQPAPADTDPADADPGPDPAAGADPTIDDVPAEAIVEVAEGGAEVRRAIETVLDFVQDTDVASLGVLGLAIVIWTVLQLLGSIERSFNDIWGVRRSRSIARKLSDYLSTLVLVPLLLVTATGVANLKGSAQVMSWLGLDAADGRFSFLLVLPVVALGFGFSYVFMPNTRVRLSSALLGGVVGGSLWQVFQTLHLELQLGVANYNAIYSTFAALPIFLFWLYASWVTVLLGAEVASAHQNEASHRQVLRARDYDQTLKEAVALRLCVRLARSFAEGAPPRTSEDLAADLGVPDRTVDEIIALLSAEGLIAVAAFDADSDAVVLTRDPARVRVQDVYDALKGATGPTDLLAEDPLDVALDRAMAEYDAARRASEANRSLAELAGLSGDGRAHAAPGALEPSVTEAP